MSINYYSLTKGIVDFCCNVAIFSWSFQPSAITEIHFKDEPTLQNATQNECCRKRTKKSYFIKINFFL